jgi:BTB/POZ domain
MGLVDLLNWIFVIEFYINLDSLKEEDTTFSSVCMKIKLSLSVDGLKHETQQETIKKISVGMAHCVWKMKIKDFKKFMKNNCKDDSVCIKFEIKEWNEKAITVMNSEDNGIIKYLPIDNTIINFLTNQTFADVTLQCQGKKFKAHKLILAAASPVFGAMFKEGTKENGDNSVNTIKTPFHRTNYIRGPEILQI